MLSSRLSLLYSQIESREITDYNTTDQGTTHETNKCNTTQPNLAEISKPSFHSAVVICEWSNRWLHVLHPRSSSRSHQFKTLHCETLIDQPSQLSKSRNRDRSKERRTYRNQKISAKITSFWTRVSRSRNRSPPEIARSSRESAATAVDRGGDGARVLGKETHKTLLYLSSDLNLCLALPLCFPPILSPPFIIGGIALRFSAGKQRCMWCDWEHARHAGPCYHPLTNHPPTRGQETNFYYYFYRQNTPFQDGDDDGREASWTHQLCQGRCPFLCPPCTYSPDRPFWLLDQESGAARKTRRWARSGGATPDKTRVWQAKHVLFLWINSSIYRRLRLEGLSF